MVGVVLAATLALGGTALAGGLQHTAPGHDGTAVTSIGYRVTPAGKQTNLGDLPLVAVSSPDGRWLVVSNDGQGAQSLQVIDIATGKVTQTLSYPAPKALFVGLAFARDGKTLYASGGGNNLIRRYGHWRHARRRHADPAADHRPGWGEDQPAARWHRADPRRAPTARRRSAG